MGIAVDPTGRYVYVADYGNHRVQKFTNNGAFLTEWGSPGTGNGQFSGPEAVAVDAAGNVYVSDHDNQLVQKFDGSGTFLTQWTTIVRSLAADARHVYVSDDFSGLVKVFDTDGNLQSSYSIRTPGDIQFSAPWGVAVDFHEFVYVADYSNSKLKVIQSGAVQNLTGALGGWDLQWLACDPAGNLYTVISYPTTGGITVFNPQGHDILSWSGGGSGNGQFARPRGVAVDGDFSVYVVDSGNSRVQKFGTAPTRVTTTTWGRLKRMFR
jgi:DNA-binding beta-propeller fold protein YncE